MTELSEPPVSDHLTDQTGRTSRPISVSWSIAWCRPHDIGGIIGDDVTPDTRSDAMDDDRDDAMGGTRWMTYAELAKSRGITKASATRLAFRKGWRRQAGNNGQARVAVPVIAQIPDHDNTDSTGRDISHDNTHDIIELANLVDMLRGQLKANLEQAIELAQEKRLRLAAEAKLADGYGTEARAVAARNSASWFEGQLEGATETIGELRSKLTAA